ncbi:MAG: UDP-glucose:(heptosyl)LPS alpha-1,3-glucosyltransferase [Myxococcota bacterium]
MKLALIVRTLGRDGGTERFVHGLASYLLTAGHTVDVWCAAVAQPIEGVTVRPLRLLGRGRTLKMLSLSRSAATVPAGDYDLVCGFIRGGSPGLYRAGGGCHAAWLAASGRRRLADRIEERLDRATVEAAEITIVNSKMAGGDLTEHYGLSSDRIRLIYNGVDLERFVPIPDARHPSGQRAVAFFGSGFTRKGLPVAIRAVAKLNGVRLTVIGGDSRPGRFKALAAELGIADRVDFLGRQPAPESLLPGHDAMILPTRYDPFANATLEALACGVPAITSGSNGAAEVLPEPWMRVADPGDVDGFAAALERTLQTEGLGAQCRAVAETLPAEGAFQQLEGCIRELTR